ncbi:MAG: fibronectin type III domain-containing protein [Bacteroidia bacterium]|nr:fibronectin type III domain-containing protein [Bacteroidia bacterium]
MDFAAYDAAQYERTKALPEGFYTLSFTAYDYFRPDVPVSNVATGNYFLAKAQPPLLNQPFCGQAQPLRQPQFINFSWTPRHQHSPNSAYQIEYLFRLFEVRPPGRNPNELVLSTPPIYEVRTPLTTLIYDMSAPSLMENMEYVWTVSVVSSERILTDLFENQGISQVCTFRYGGLDQDFSLGTLSGFRAEAVAPQRLRVSWQAQPARFSGYRLAYRRVVEGQERPWSQDEIKEGATAQYDLLPLEPNWTYELRLQGQSGSKYGPFTQSIQVTMPPPRAVECDSFPKAKAPKSEVPLREVYPNMVIDAYGKEMTLIQAQMLPQEGWFKGSGYIRLAFTANLRSLVHFEQLYINEHRQAVRGMIHFARRPVPPVPVPEEESPKPEEETPAPINPSARWPGVVFHGEILRYEGFEIDSVAYDPESEEWLIYREGGEVIRETDIRAILVAEEADAVVIEDASGDQWVVQAGGKVEEVPGGGD